MGWRAMAIMSQPSANASRLGSGEPRRPLPVHTISSARPSSSKSRLTRRKPSLKGSDVVGEDERRCAGAALTAIDGDHVGCPQPRYPHPPREVLPEGLLAHRGLDAHGEPGAVRDFSQRFLIRLSTSEKAVWAAGLMQSTPCGMPRTRDLRRDLPAGSTPPRPGFAP